MSGLDLSFQNPLLLLNDALLQTLNLLLQRIPFLPLGIMLFVVLQLYLAEVVELVIECVFGLVLPLILLLLCAFPHKFLFELSILLGIALIFV